MNLPFLKSKKETKEYFLALILSLGEIRGILFEKTESGLIILGTKKEEFEGVLEDLTPEKLIETSDVVISDVEKNLPGGVEFEKIIFVVSHSWVIEGKIVKAQLLKLKNLCEVLRLTPIGFIVSIEAISAYLHRTEGVPVTAIFAEIGKKHIILSIVKNGSVIYIADEEIKEDAISSVGEILSAQDATEVLPSKIILLNFDNAKRLEQQFTTHQWSRKLQFLHIPKVEVLSSEIESQAVISGVATQMGFSTVSGVQVGEGSVHEEAVEDKRVSREIEEKTYEGEQKTLHFTGEAIGFFQEVDVLKEKQEIKATQEEEVASEQNHAWKTSSVSQDNTAMVEQGENKGTKIPKIDLSFFRGFIKNLSSGNKSFLYPVLAVISLILIIFGYYFFFEKIEVVLVLNKQEVKKDLTVTFSEDKKTSADDGIVHVKINSVKENGKEQKATTGKKETGEKAKGEVSILSSLNKETTIEKGTVLTSSNSLEFTLDSDVKIASSSGISDVKNSKGKLTAEDIGKEYNLPSGTKFTISGYDASSVEAKNDSAFSGGSKKEIKVVSRDDIASLTTKIISTLSKKAIEKAVSGKKQREDVLSVPLGYTFDDKIFSKEEGEEADTLTLSATISYDLGYYSNEEMGLLAKDISDDKIPEDYKYSEKDSKIKVEDVKENDNGQISGKVSFSSVFIPDVAVGDVSQKIAGKSESKTEEILSSDGISDVQIVYQRSLPLFPKILPFNKKNIVITSKTE